MLGENMRRLSVPRLGVCANSGLLAHGISTWINRARLQYPSQLLGGGWRVSFGCVVARLVFGANLLRKWAEAF